LCRPESFQTLTQRRFQLYKKLAGWADEHLTIAPYAFIIGSYIGITWSTWRSMMRSLIQRIWSEDQGQDIAEYAVMLAVILVLVVGTIRLVGSNANTVFSNVASSVQ
jgi:Flp pilus assembly pilin Flp